MISEPTQSAAAIGYRMPAEWEPHAAVWVTPPHNPETWPGCLDAAQAQFDAWVTVMRQVVTVRTTDELHIATNDSWIRDFGPIFVVHSPAPIVQSSQSKTPDSALRTTDSSLACHDFRFNGWGGKYEQRDLDDAVPPYIARELNIPLWTHDFILEGGSIDVNGQGTVMTTEQCLLNENRNPLLTRATLEAKLHDALGTTHCIWLPGGIVGDDTDGHVDDIARFVAPDRVVAVSAPPDHPDHAVLSRNLAALRAAHDQNENPMQIIELPAPEPISYDFPPDRFGPGGRHPVPASYANFLITNGRAFMPAFGQKRDDQAARALEHAMPGFTITPVRAEHLVVGLGALHCLSQQQPAVPV